MQKYYYLINPLDHSQADVRLVETEAKVANLFLLRLDWQDLRERFQIQIAENSAKVVVSVTAADNLESVFLAHPTALIGGHTHDHWPAITDRLD